jgi:xanthine dehydrogenase YagR molybdenum-binding subunit
VAAARDLGRPLKFELTRAQMFTLIGRRQETIQDLRIGATQAGKLTAIVHDIVAQTSTHSDYADPTATVSRMLYACPNVATSHRLVRLNAPHPCPMRAPGEGPGSFALESALDELAYQLDLDPIELRLRNQAGRDQHVDRPWSSNGLKACLATAAHAFGWDKRPSRIRTLREGSLCIGMGMATACYPYYSLPSEAVVALSPEGRISVRCATQDMGSGTYTALSQLVANELGVSPSDVEVELGDSDLPEGPYSGGSMATASFAPAVTLAAQNLKSKLLATATTDAESVLHGANPNELVVGRGYVSAPRTNRAESFADLLRRSGDIAREGHARTVPDAKPQFSAYAFGAVFAEVGVDEELGQVWVRRITAAYAAGKIINPLLARSQYVGGLIGGVGMALHEQTIMDQRLGHVMNDNMADYLIPVHADMPEFDIHIVQEDDPHLPGGVKGIGMLGTVGTAAAIANAVYHATGRRIRDLPIRTEQFL